MLTTEAPGSPVTFMCVFFFSFASAFSTAVSLPAVPLSGESVFTQHDLWAVTVGGVHPSLPWQPKDAASVSGCHLGAEAALRSRCLSANG